MSNRQIPLVGHLAELKTKLVKSIVFTAISSGLFYLSLGTILPHIIKPAGRLVFIAPQEAFVTDIKLAFFGGVFFSSPFILYQIWDFIRSGLNKNEKRYVAVFAPLSFLFFLLGSGFGYIVVMPIGMKFLLGFATELIIPMISMARYVSFLGVLTLAFGVVFEFPIIALFLTKIGVITPEFMARHRREAAVSIFILAAVITPPDVITQCLMAVPLLALYELSIIFSGMARG